MSVTNALQPDGTDSFPVSSLHGSVLRASSHEAASGLKPVLEVGNAFNSRVLPFFLGCMKDNKAHVV